MIVHLPRSLSELWSLLAEAPGARVMAGGTDLLVRLRAGLDRTDATERTGKADAATALCCLERIPELRGVDCDKGQLRIGAATPLTTILENQDVATRLPMLHAACRCLGSPLIRHQATLGGNICTASPAGDTLPALYALGAEVELATSNGTRRLPMDGFITGPGRTLLQPAELLTAVHIPLPAPNALQYYEKVGKRRALAISVASLAALLRLEGQRITEARLALGSVAPTVVRCTQVEHWLAGRPLDAETLHHAAGMVREVVRPITDVRATAAYRRIVAGNLLLRLGGHQ